MIVLESFEINGEDEFRIKIDTSRDTNKGTTDSLNMDKMTEVQGWPKAYSYCRRRSKWCG